MYRLTFCILSIYFTASCFGGDDFNGYYIPSGYTDSVVSDRYEELTTNSISYPVLSLLNPDSVFSLIISGYKNNIPKDITAFKELEFLSIESIDTIDLDLLDQCKDLRFLQIEHATCIKGLITNSNLQTLYLQLDPGSSYTLNNSLYELNNLQCLTLRGQITFDNRIQKLSQLRDLSIEYIPQLKNVSIPRLHFYSIYERDTSTKIQPAIFNANNSIEAISITGIDYNPINTDFSTFKKLEHLHIENCRINQSKIIIANPNRITSIGLEYDSLTDIPTIIYDLKNLSKLNIYGNYIDTLGAELNNLPNLKGIFASYNNIKHISPGLNLSNLEKLFLDFNKLEELPKIEAPKLQEINLRANYFHEIPEWLKTKPGCTSNLDENYISDTTEYKNITIGIQYSWEQHILSQRYKVYWGRPGLKYGGHSQFSSYYDSSVYVFDKTTKRLIPVNSFKLSFICGFCEINFPIFTSNNDHLSNEMKSYISNIRNVVKVLIYEITFTDIEDNSVYFDGGTWAGYNFNTPDEYEKIPE